MIDSLKRISKMLVRCSGADPIFPPTDLYNEGWMLRLILDWHFTIKEQSHQLPFMNAGRWYSEALLPSAFLPRYKGDKLAESWTHADGALGDFSIGGYGAGDLVLSKDAQHLTILEAKMFSTLSPGVTHAPYYNQAARTIACIAEILRRANREPGPMKSLGFFVLAPKEQIAEGVFASQLDKNSIRNTVKRRVSEYDGGRTEWFDSWFLPTLQKIEIAAVSWEALLEMINRVDPIFGEELSSFYQRCLRFNKKVLKVGNAYRCQCGS